MPGAGKTTVGKILAEKMNCRFVDLDSLIFEKSGISHHELMKQKGEGELKALEEKYALEIDFNDIVFSPPGSMVFSEKVMEKAKNESVVIYLKVSKDGIEKRLGENLYKDGIIGLETKGLAGVISERVPLYEKYNDFIIETDGLEPETIMFKIFNLLKII